MMVQRTKEVSRQSIEHVAVEDCFDKFTIVNGINQRFADFATSFECFKVAPILVEMWRQLYVSNLLNMDFQQYAVTTKGGSKKRKPFVVRIVLINAGVGFLVTGTPFLTVLISLEVALTMSNRVPFASSNLWL